MFGIGMPEMLLILAVALIVFGPKRLPELAKSLGRALGEFKRATSDLKESIETDTGLDQVRSSFDEVKKDIKSQMDSADSTPPEGSGPASETSDSEEPLGKVKSAFDQMNAESDPPPTHESESEDPPAIDPDAKSQENTTP